jgi:uncharacterized membrane protein
MVAALTGMYGIGAFRTIDEDPGFGIRQLVDMALKALSPGINDTTTAVTCMEHLGLVLESCALNNLDARHQYDGDVLRVVAKGPGFRALLRLAFAQIIESAGGNTEIMKLLLSIIRAIATLETRPEVYAALSEQVEVIEEVARNTAKSRTALSELVAEVGMARAVIAAGARQAAA